MLGLRDAHERSENIVMRAFRRAAASIESSDDATAYRRPSKLVVGAGRIGARGCGKNGPSPSIQPVSSASLTIIEPSSKRSRDSSISIAPKLANSRRDRPRPIPKRTRPPDTWSSRAMRSATRSGSFHGMITAAVPSPTVSWRPAM